MSWNGDYFIKTVIPEVNNALKDRTNVLYVDGTIILHDRAPGWAAKATQEVVEDEPTDFFKSSEYPGSSPMGPNLKPTENIGSILMEKVDEKMQQERGEGR